MCTQTGWQIFLPDECVSLKHNKNWCVKGTFEVCLQLCISCICPCLIGLRADDLTLAFGPQGKVGISRHEDANKPQNSPFCDVCQEWVAIVWNLPSAEGAVARREIGRTVRVKCRGRSSGAPARPAVPRPRGCWWPEIVFKVCLVFHSKQKTCKQQHKTWVHD